MTIEDIARKYKLRLKTKNQNYWIPGKLGDMYMHDENNISACFMPDEPSKGWKNRKEQFVKAGAEVTQSGDTEGVVTFPADAAKVIRLAVKLIGLYRTRKTSPEVTEKRVEGLKKARIAKNGKKQR